MPLRARAIEYDRCEKDRKFRTLRPASLVDVCDPRVDSKRSAALVARPLQLVIYCGASVIQTQPSGISETARSGVCCSMRSMHRLATDRRSLANSAAAIIASHKAGMSPNGYEYPVTPSRSRGDHCDFAASWPSVPPLIYKAAHDLSFLHLQLRRLLGATVAKHQVAETYQIPFEPPRAIDMFLGPK